MTNADFSHEELERYSRHLILPEFNVEGQKKLKNSKVLIVGAGKIGTLVACLLALQKDYEVHLADKDIKRFEAER